MSDQANVVRDLADRTDFRRQGSTSRGCLCDANLSCAGAKKLLAASGGACAHGAAFALPPQLLGGCVASWVYTATYFCKDSIALVSIAKRPLPCVP